MCFQVNQNGSMRTSVAGSSGGIILKINANTAQYTASPGSAADGFLVSEISLAL